MLLFAVDVIWCTSTAWESGTADVLGWWRCVVINQAWQYTAAVPCIHIPTPTRRRRWALR